MPAFGNIKTALAIAPHRDDYELGAGGTIARLLEEGVAVHSIIFCLARIYPENEYPPENYALEALDAAKTLGLDIGNIEIMDLPIHELPAHRQTILQRLVDIRNSLNPDLVICPSLNDWHQDHKTVAQEAIRAFKDRTILGWEEPWNNLQFSPQLVVALEDEHLITKINAITKYESQRGRAYCAHDFLVSWARFRGTQISVRYGESFEVVRWVIR